MTEEEKTEEPTQIIEKEGTRPCGCHEKIFADGRTEVSPCPPHALMEAARLFMQAGNMLGSVGQQLLNAQQQQAMQAVAEAVKNAGGPRGLVE